MQDEFLNAFKESVQAFLSAVETEEIQVTEKVHSLFELYGKCATLFQDFEANTSAAESQQSGRQVRRSQRKIKVRFKLSISPTDYTLCLSVF